MADDQILIFIIYTLKNSSFVKEKTRNTSVTHRFVLYSHKRSSTHPINYGTMHINTTVSRERWASPKKKSG